MDRREADGHVPPYLFTIGFYSMLMLVSRFTLDQPNRITRRRRPDPRFASHVLAARRTQYYSLPLTVAYGWCSCSSI